LSPTPARRVCLRLRLPPRSAPFPYTTLFRSVRSGLVRSHDSFYTDQEEELTRSWAARGVLASDMETAALFTVARLRGVRAGSILNVVVTAEGELEEGINRLVASEEAAAAGPRASIQAARRGGCRLWLEEKQR